MGKNRAKPGWSLWLALAVLSTPAVATAQDVMARAGDWDYGSDAAMSAASTHNARGWLFGLVCSPDCIGFIENDQRCDEGRRYEGRMRTALRENQVPLECRHLEGRYALLFTPTEAFIDMLTGGPEISVTVRLRGEEDTDFRFSLNGAYDAVYMTLATEIATSGTEANSSTP